MSEVYYSGAMGQSNIVGNGGNGSAAGPQNWASNHLVGNNTTNTSSTDPATFGTAMVPPDLAQNPFHFGNNNYAAQYASLLAATMPTVTVHQPIVAKGGQKIDAWMSAIDVKGVKGDMYTRTQNVLAALGITQPLNDLVWGQSENNDPVSGEFSNVGTPLEKLQADPLLFAALMADGIIDANTMIFVMEAYKTFSLANAVNRVIAAQIPNAFIVPIANFPVDSSGVHFQSAVTQEIGQAIMDVRAKALNPPALDSGRIEVAARSSFGQKVYEGNGSTYLTGFTPINFNAISEDTHGLFDGTVFHVERTGKYDIRGLFTARDQLYPAGSEFSAAMFKLVNGTWIRDISFGFTPVEGSLRTSPEVKRAFTRKLIKGDKVWFGTRLSPAPGTSFPFGVNPRLSDADFLVDLTIRELDV